MRIHALGAGLAVAGVVAAALVFLSEPEESAVFAQAPASQQQAGSPDQIPKFTERGDLVRPEDWERWVMVGSSIGLSYSEPRRERGPDEAPGMFHNIYMQPWAYDFFMEHGEFAEGTMFAMSLYSASRNADPARGGFYQGDRAPFLEVHVKKAGIDSTGWAFFNFASDSATTARVPAEASCYSCHATNAAFDNVFTQFYPPLRARLGQTDSAQAGQH